MKCDCAKWENGIKEIDSIIVFASTHGIGYRGGVFRYCPWCGKKLEFSEEEETLIEIFGMKDDEQRNST